MRVIFAYSEEDPEGEDPFYHKENRGTKSILLLQSKTEKDHDLDDPTLQHWDVKLENVIISFIKVFYTFNFIHFLRKLDKNSAVNMGLKMRDLLISFLGL